MTTRGHQLAIDWSQQGTYANAQEDATSRIQKGTEIEIAWGRDMDGEVTLKATSGSMSFALNNQDRVLSPEYASSPIFGKVLPGRAVRYQVSNAASALYTLHQGVIDSYEVDSDAARTFSVSALDGWGRPGSEQLSTPLYQGIRTGTAIGLVLDAIGWTGPRQIDPGASVLPWWWEEGTDAATAVDRIVASEGHPAIAFVQGGTFVFRDRHHRILSSRSLTSQGLYTHIIPAGSGPGGDLKIEKETFSYNHGINKIVNNVVFPVDIRGPIALAEVWSTDDAFTIPAGGAVRIAVETTDPFMNAITPTLVDGDIIQQSGTLSGVSITRTSGSTCTIVISATTASVITRLALRANSVPVRRTVQVSARDQSSIGIFGNQGWPDESDPVWAHQYDAQAIADRIVAVYANYRPTLTFTVFALNAAYVTELLDTFISDRITVRNDAMGVNADFIVERLTHKFKAPIGMQHRVEIVCTAVEPVQPTNVFTFDTAGKGFNDGLFGIDGIDNPTNVFLFDKSGQGFDQGFFAH